MGRPTERGEKQRQLKQQTDTPQHTQSALIVTLAGSATRQQRRLEPAVESRRRLVKAVSAGLQSCSDDGRSTPTSSLADDVHCSVTAVQTPTRLHSQLQR